VTQQQGDWNTLVPVTGEAVALDLRIAQFPSRTLGLLLDLVVQIVLLIIVVFLVGDVAGAADGAAGPAIMLVSVVMVIVGLPTIVETLTRGRSLGKLATGLRVVRDDGGPVRFRHSFVRALFMIIDFWISSGAVGLISSLSSTRAKRLGDHFAGTVVVRERVPSAAGIVQHVYAMPPGLEGWAASLDLARLPDVTAQQARQLLTRAGGLAPDVREAMGRRLAAEVSAYVSPPPPPGVPAEAYLSAVLTERMRRSTARAQMGPRRVAPVTAPAAAAPPAPAVSSQVSSPTDGPFTPPA
jgi:uncharacterized RDD family membrane protein YckC